MGPDYCMLSCFSCIQLCDPLNCSPPVSSVGGISQLRILEWVAMIPRKSSLFFEVNIHDYILRLF